MMLCNPMSRRALAWMGLLMLAWAASVLAAGVPTPVFQSSQGSLDQDVGMSNYFTLSRGVTLFAGCDAANGSELWIDDNTSSVSILMDINPGPAGSSPHNFASLGGIAYFMANNQLWRTDGTRAGTGRVSAKASVAGLSPEPPLVVCGGVLYFCGSDAAHGFELWRSDGTDAGTWLVKDISSGADSSTPRDFVMIGGTLFFTAQTPSEGRQLWKSDGTAAGTVMLGGTMPLSANAAPGNLAVAGATLFFTQTDPQLGTELWKSDGTAAGTVMVKDLNPGSGSSSPVFLSGAGGKLFFKLNGGAELWTSDGSAAGTFKLKDITPSSWLNPDPPMAAGGRLYFVDCASGGYELWASDGTVAGTVMLQHEGMMQGGTQPRGLVVMNGALYCFGYYSGGDALWKIEGLTMTKVTDVSGVSGIPTMVTSVAAGNVFYFGKVTMGHDYYYSELWKSDGTAAGTVKANGFKYSSGGLNPGALTAMNGQLLFYIGADSQTQQIWKSDGSAGGTKAVFYDASRNQTYFKIAGLTVDDGRLWFMVNYDLWYGDGTITGSVKAKAPSLIVYYLLKGGVPYLFQYSSGPQPSAVRLYRYDEAKTSATLLANLTTPVLDFYQNPQYRPVVAGSVMFLLAGDAAHGIELWRSDGTREGTAMVKDIAPGPQSSSPSNLVTVGERPFFIADDQTSHGQELWVSDGTAAGTHMVLDIFPGAGSSAPANLTAVGDRLFFSAEDGVSGRELWVSDGTPEGTTRVCDICPGAAGSDPSSLTAFNGRVWFAADDGVHGRELWTSDGTAAGTVLVKDIEPGPLGSVPAGLAVANGRLWLSAWTRDTGVEPWSSDGTAAGTRLVGDLMPGPGSSSPGDFTGVCGVLFFTAEHSATDQGRELWRITDSASAVRCWLRYE